VHRLRFLRTLIGLVSIGCVIPISLNLCTYAQVPRTPPARWVGAHIQDNRIVVSVASTGGSPRAVVTERDPKRSQYSLTITDVAFDARREVIYVATCCEPGSGALRRVDLRDSAPTLAADDQGFAVDVAGGQSTIARTDTFGTLAFRQSPTTRQEVRAQAGASDVAVDGTAEARVIALIQSERLRALVPTVSARDPALLVLRWATARWTGKTHGLAADTTYCAVVALSDGAVGLLAGQVDRAHPIVCAGDRLDIYDTATGALRTGAARFPGKVRHLSVDDTSAFLIFTTLDGAVRWQTLDGNTGSLASRGFLAADW